ncbi:hypothetical protein [Thiothrix lacustris]|uniref:hypothetical protein n=1 Tax=Thiothrix lacustris TaxID=525917 RepID=UPI0027E3DABF|nr:hypothetical protein [Thiothrix lacustris]WMP18757.1 hypothetical protein RCS87_06775 [Thiothrix lacustris]
MHTKHLIPLAFIALLHSSALWANGLNIFQGSAAPAQPPQQQLQPNMSSQSESVQVQTLPDGRYHAEINYQDKTDDTRNFTFEGTQEEIHQQVQQNTTLPAERKQALLQALEMRPEALFNQPMFGGSNPFNDPFFKNSPLNDDFFKQLLDDMPDFGQMPDLQQFFQPPTAITPAPPAKPTENQHSDKIFL